jgi:hypothetical protein
LRVIEEAGFSTTTTLQSSFGTPALISPFPRQQNIQAFYPPGSLDMIAAQVASSGALDKIATEWRMPKEIATDLVKISLFDVVLYVDDSGEFAPSALVFTGYLG